MLCLSIRGTQGPAQIRGVLGRPAGRTGEIVAHTVFELVIVWDGHHLIANRRFGDGWEQLTGRQPSHPPNVSTPCTELEDLTPFELGLFMATAGRAATDFWYDSQPALMEEDSIPRTRATG